MSTDLLIAGVTLVSAVLVALINQGRLTTRSKKRTDESTSTMDEMLDRLLAQQRTISDRDARISDLERQLAGRSPRRPSPRGRTP